MGQNNNQSNNANIKGDMMQHIQTIFNEEGAQLLPESS